MEVLFSNISQPNYGSLGGLMAESFYLHNDFDLHGEIEGENIGANGRTGMSALVAKNLHQEVGCAIDHLGLVIEVRAAGNKPHKLDKLLHPVQITQFLFQNAQDIDHGLPGGLIPFFNRPVLSQLALEKQLSIRHRPIA